jgi:hypothetical protein
MADAEPEIEENTPPEQSLLAKTLHNPEYLLTFAPENTRE